MARMKDDRDLGGNAPMKKLAYRLRDEAQARSQAEAHRQSILRPPGSRKPGQQKRTYAIHQGKPILPRNSVM
jgi:hypothetical protein